jgi:hypothetical protein
MPTTAVTTSRRALHLCPQKGSCMWPFGSAGTMATALIPVPPCRQIDDPEVLWSQQMREGELLPAVHGHLGSFPLRLRDNIRAPFDYTCAFPAPFPSTCPSLAEVKQDGSCLGSRMPPATALYVNCCRAGRCCRWRTRRLVRVAILAHAAVLKHAALRRPMPPMAYGALKGELWCHRYYLSKLCSPEHAHHPVVDHVRFRNVRSFILCDRTLLSS